MFRWLSSLLRRKKQSGNDPWQEMDISDRYHSVQTKKISKKVEENLEIMGEIMGNSPDLTIRRFLLQNTVPGALVYISGMVDNRTVEEVLQGLFFKTNHHKGKDLFQTLMKSNLIVGEVVEEDGFEEIFHQINTGKTVFFVEGNLRSLLLDTKGREFRQIKEPDAEITIRGPRVGFVENIRLNTTLIRSRIRTPHLWIEQLKIGHLSQTEVEIVYMKGLADESLINEVRSRLKRIVIDGVLESGYLEEMIEDEPFTIFPLVLRTERPDIACAALLEGRVLILTDGTPHALIVPVELSSLMQAPDDYYEKQPLGTLTRVIRIIGLLLSILLPGFYVAVLNFHQELIPTVLLLRIIAAREGLPFPVIVEILLMESLFELLREAGIRLPAAIGPAISIVGALILGDAAIRAGLVSPAVVIIIALTAIASFSAPVYSLAIAMRVIRFVFTVTGGIFGLFGIQIALLVLVVHLSSLRSFGVPYFSPLGPFKLSDMKDHIIRFFWWGMEERPSGLSHQEPRRQPKGQKPQRSQEEGE